MDLSEEAAISLTILVSVQPRRMMEEYTDICSLLGLDSGEAGSDDKQTIIEETLSDPSDLLDFLVSEEFREDCGYRGSYSASLLSNLNIDINLNINGRKGYLPGSGLTYKL